jgi:hypothetical protein
MEGDSRKKRRLIIGVLFITIAAAASIPPLIVKNMSDPAAEQAVAEEQFRTPTPSATVKGLLVVTGEVGVDVVEQAGDQASGQNDPHNCTFAPEYWKSRPDAWPIEGLQIGGLALDKAEAVAVLTNDPPDTKAVLLQQLVVYALNTFRGADPRAVLPAIKEISDWIGTYGAFEIIPQSALEQGRSLANILLQYNTGLIGPGICPDITDTPTTMPSETPTVTATPSPTATSTPTYPPVFPTSTSVSPPGNPPPTQPPPPPTAVPTQPPPTPVPTQPPPPPTSPPPTAPPTPVPPDPSTPTPAP